MVSMSGRSSASRDRFSDVPEYKTGSIIDNEFMVLSALGGGAFGLVLRIERLLDGREYAMKIFYSTAAREFVERELRALQAVNHPNINKVVWAGQLRSGEWYLLTELVEGTGLVDYIAPDHLLPPGEFVRMGTQLLDALAALHPDVERIKQLKAMDELDEDAYNELRALEESGLVHRDIKPENIRVRHSGELVLIDFGIASRVGARISTQTSTPGYAPPDFDLTCWSPDVDLFAAGAVICELACGSVPYPPPNGGLVDARELRPDLPAELCEFLATACASQRANRFESAVEMRKALFRVAQDIAAEERSREAATGPEQSSDPDNLNLLAPFTPWRGRPLPGASGVSTEQTIEAFVEIVEAEGPLMCRRLYELYVSASGDPGVASVKRHLNRAAYAAVRDGMLSQVEPLGGGQADKTVYLPGTPPIVVRERGPRPINQIPPSEVYAFAQTLTDNADLADEEELDDVFFVLQMMYDAESADWWELRYLASCLGVDLAAPSD